MRRLSYLLAGLMIACCGCAGTSAKGTTPEALQAREDCSRALERLQRENARLRQEIDQLKNVDVQLHRQKMDTGNATETGKNPRP